MGVWETSRVLTNGVPPSYPAAGLELNRTMVRVATCVDDYPSLHILNNKQAIRTRLLVSRCRCTLGCWWSVPSRKRSLILELADRSIPRSFVHHSMAFPGEKGRKT